MLHLFIQVLSMVFAFDFLVGKADLFYEDPTYPLHSPNFTIGGLFAFANETGGINYDSIDGALAMFCTLNGFSKAQGPFPVEGVFNGMVYGASEPAPAASFIAMKLLGHNLRPSSIETNNIAIGAILSSIDINSYVATAPIFRDYPLTFLGIQYLGSGMPYNGTLNVLRMKPRLVPQDFVISMGASASMADAIIRILLHFNWTLVTVLYGGDVFGMEGQALLEPLLQRESILTICSNIVEDVFTASTLQNVTTCLNHNQQSNVVIFWSGAPPATALNFTLSLQESCSRKLTIIYPGIDSDSLVVREIEDGILEPLSQSFVFKNKNALNRISSIEECLRDINPGNQTYFPKNDFKEYWDESVGCDGNTLNCTLLPMASKKIVVNEAIKATMVILKSISLLQTNCTLLNSLMKEFGPELAQITKNNYCDLTTFSASDVWSIINLILVLGIPEFLNVGLNRDSSIALAQIQVLQVQDVGNLKVVGYYTGTDSVTILNDQLYWSDNQTPVSGNNEAVHHYSFNFSEVQVDNPTLDDAIVAVFFSFTILGAILSISLHVFTAIYRERKEIRKSSLMMLNIILLGIDFCLAALICLGQTYTTYVCFQYAWFLVLGCGLIVSTLLGRIFRIYKIFSNPNAVALILKDSWLVIIILSVLSIEIALLSIYSFASGTLGPEVIQSTTDIYYQYRTCSAPNAGFQLAMQISFYIFNLGLVGILAVMTFLMRKFHECYSESREIAYTVYTSLVLCAIFAPVLYTVSDSTDTIQVQYTITAMWILLTTYSLMAHLFGGKVYSILIGSSTKLSLVTNETRN